MEERELSNLNYNILYCIFLPSALYYCLQINNDPITNLLFVFILILLTSIFQSHHKKIVLFIIMVISLMELALKIMMSLDLFGFIDKSMFNLQIHENLLSLSDGLFSLNFLVYFLMLWLSCMLPFVYNSNDQNTSGQYYRFLKTISNTLELITPFLIYILCFTKLTPKSFRQWLENLSPDLHFSNYEMLEQVGWGLVTILFLIFNKQKLYLRKYLTILIILIIVRDHYTEHHQNLQLYNLRPIFINMIKTAIILFFRIHNQTIQANDSDQVDEGSSNRMSSYKKFTIKRKLTIKSGRNQKYVIILLIFTIVTMIMTNGLGNILVIIGVFLNIPEYNESSFRNYIALGITISFLLQPSQFIYFVFLYVARYITTFDYTFQNQNLYILAQVSRIVILLSKVSVLNFFIGLFQSKYLIVFTLVFRTTFSYFDQVLVFMGTQDNYEYLLEYFIPSSIFRDLQLWVYLIVLKLYSPASTIKFRGTDITNIFQQYKILIRVQRLLKILKIFHWIAYITLSLIILNRKPSLFTLLRIIPLLISFLVGLFQAKKSQCTLILWYWNFYTALSIVFVKYFYLLTRYDNLSPWLITVLDPLKEHHEIIGLNSPNESQLWVAFGPDFIVILMNAIVIFLIKIQLEQIHYEIQRQRIIQQQNLQNPLILQSKEQERNIHYLYHQYIKPIQFKFKEKSKFRPLFTDFILDLYFISFLFIFYFIPDHNYSYIYMIHFLIYFYGYKTQQNKKNKDMIFRLMIGIGSLDILILYLTYFFNLTNKENHYNIKVVLSKYLILVIAILFYETNEALSKFYKENKSVQLQENSYIVFKVLSPDIPYEKIKKEVVSLYMSLFKILSLSYFFSIIISQSNLFQFTHGLTLLVIVIIKTLTIHYKEFDKITWAYYCKFAIMFDLFAARYFFYDCSTLEICESSSYDTSLMDKNTHSFFLCFLFLRIYIMMVSEFSIMISTQLYGAKSPSIQVFLPHLDKKINQIQQKYNAQRQLQIIQQVREIRQKSSYQTFSSDKQIIWRYKNMYATLIWMLPLMSILIVLFGVTQYVAGYYGYALFWLGLIALIYYLRKFQSISIENRFISIMMQLIFFVYVASISDKMIFNILYQDYFQSKHFFIGNFFILFGLMGYYELWKNKFHKNIPENHEYSYLLDFTLKRSSEAIQYWKNKCDMVSELGSQIHNEKKMSHLKKFHLNKQKLSAIIQQLSSELKSKSSHRKSRFEQFSKIEIPEQRKEQFQMYSNMLTFMSTQDLQYCYKNLNLYFKGELDINLFQATKIMRKDILLKRQSAMSLKESLCKYLQELNCKEQLKKVEQKPQKEEEQQSKRHYVDKQQKKEETQQKKLIKSQVKSENEEYEQNIKRLQNICEIQCKEAVDRQVQSDKMEQDLCGQRIDQRLKELNWISRYVVQNSQIIGLVVIAGWNFYGGVYTIPANIAIFSWAIVLQSKTTVIFWLFLLTYSSIILSFKFILHSLPKQFFFDFLFYYHPTEYFYEYIIIFTCAVEIILLKFGGISEIPYSQRQNIFDSFYRHILNQTSKGLEKPHMNSFLKIYKKLTESTKHSFIHRVFSKGRLKPGKDFYPSLAIVQVIILFYIFFFYDMMQFQSKNNRKSLGEILTVTQFSKNMILALLFQIIIMVTDRVIVSLNIIDQVQQKLQNYIFNVAFSSEIKEYEPLRPEELEKLNTFDYLLIIKYVFHVVLLILINFLVYFYIPSGGLEKSIIPKCQNAVCGKSYKYLSIFLFLYLIYFMFSGLQIKHGFNRNKCKNTLMEKYHWINYYIYMLFTGIPFLWQFKKISDWTTTATALPLFHWMKFQDINARMYQSKCQSEILRIKPLGKGPWYKLLMGPPGFIFILALIFSPIIMYSSFNPFAIEDTIQASTFKFNLIMDDKLTYQFFETSITSISNDLQFDGHDKKILGLFDRASLYKITASNFPDNDFMLSEPAVNQLLSHLNRTYHLERTHKFQFKLLVVVSEKQGGQTEIEWGNKILNTNEIQGLCNLISNETQLYSFNIMNFYSPLPGQISNLTISLDNINNAQYFELKIRQQQSENQDLSNGLFIFYKSQVKYKAAIGLLTFYLTYVVLINSLFRFYLTGGLEIILFQGCELEKILFLCDAVRSARILQNFYQQEYLYFSLVDLMRYPRMIKNIASDFSNLRKRDKNQVKNE